MYATFGAKGRLSTQQGRMPKLDTGDPVFSFQNPPAPWSGPGGRATGEPGRKGRPFITIAIPAFSRPLMLAEALASIAAQTARVDLEVIICDDGRLPETRAIAQQFRGRGYVYLPNPSTLGAVANWNRCLQEARGDWVMVLHEDDLLYPWYLESVLPHLQAGTAAVCMRTTQGVAPPRVRRARATAYPPRYFLKSSMTPFPGVLIRREVALGLGGFDAGWGPLADYEFWYRLSCHGRVEVIRAIGAFYRVAPGQWTERIWRRMLRLTHLLRLRIAREQFAASPRAGRWMARFFTFRNARCYGRRFGSGPTVLRRCGRLGRIPLSGLPAGWVWRALKFATRSEAPHVLADAHASRAPQIQPGGGGPRRLPATGPVGGPAGQPAAARARDRPADGHPEGEARDWDSHRRANDSRQVA
jgi:glycosyltransferase involved in cell wall biosynthesis